MARVETIFIEQKNTAEPAKLLTKVTKIIDSNVQRTNQKSSLWIRDG